MPDIFSKEKRSELMSHIRSSGTVIEQRLQTIVYEALGGDWKLQENVRCLPGSPDVVIPGLRLAIFANGCFFHCCPSHGRVPESNRDYWEPKLVANKRRDNRNYRHLRAAGLSVWCVWEHDLEGKRLAKTTRIFRSRLLRRAATMGVEPISQLSPTSSPPSAQG